MLSRYLDGVTLMAGDRMRAWRGRMMGCYVGITPPLAWLLIWSSEGCVGLHMVDMAMSDGPLQAGV